MPKLLLVDDEPVIRRTLRDILEFEDYEIEEAGDGMEALVKLRQGKFDCCVMDIKMPQLDGMDALERVRLLLPDLPVIMISGHADIDPAVEAVKHGAFDFLSKPLDLNRILITVRNALDRSTLITEKQALQRKVRTQAAPAMIGESEGLTHIKETIVQVGPTDARVLITGPNGTGKELVARHLHAASKRAEKTLVEVNCAAIPDELIESELFGHEKGSFTGASQQRIGKFEQASGGTLFLDEIGDMSHGAQAKVLRALQEQRITRVGGTKEIRVDVRVLAATNRDLRAEIAAGRFREDLYHRLAVILIDVPGLNDRRADIPHLIEYFSRSISRANGSNPARWDAPALDRLTTLNWTGNIRELRNVVERLLILGGQTITLADVERYVIPGSAPAAPDSLPDLLRQSCADEAEAIALVRSAFAPQTV
ncbi:MAG: sigma-54 dependent transcriptional regulator [Saprospiraceae bacterium]